MEITVVKHYVYIAGGMRGLPWFNFDQFYTAEDEVLERHSTHDDWVDWEAGQYPGEIWSKDVVIFNPARYDHDVHGFEVNPESGDLDDITVNFNLNETLLRDLTWISEKATAVYMLDGWERSKGASAERALALALGIQVIYQPSLDVEEFWEDTTGTDIVTEVRLTSETGGEKGSKMARFDLIPVGPLTTLASLYGKGAEKYADRNWERGYAWSLSYAALMRHVTAFWGGQDLDPEHGLPHLASVAWHALALMEWAQTHPEFDNRPKG